MTNNTIPNVPRELLERLALQRKQADWLEMNTASAFAAAKELRVLLDATPSPAGVDGLEVVAWQLGCQTMGGDVGYVLSWNKSGAGVCSRLKGEEHERALCRLSDAQAIIDGLRGEVDQQAQRIGELASHLEFAVTMLTVAGLAGNAQVEAMRAALSAGHEPKQCT